MAPKNAVKFSCDVCSFSCSKMCDWQRHAATKKHLDRLESNGETVEKVHQCVTCDRVFQTRTGLWKHGQKCVKMEPIAPAQNASVTPEMISRIVVEIHRQLGITDLLKNSEEMVKNSQELVKLAKEAPVQTVNNTNTTNNTQFNVNFFLNEKCKDAINFTDFVNSITLNQEALKTVVKHGHVEGNTRIIADMLEKLGVYRRPIHCTDMKRETVYIRENDEWEKEQVELPRIKRLADVVSHKVIQQSNVWQEVNPDFMNSDEKKKECLDIMTSIFASDSGNEEQSQKKIIKNILLQTEVDKCGVIQRR
jgi:hypothetical protein